MTSKHVAEIGEIDVLFTPVGGGPTVSPGLASSIVGRLDPRIAVPMHYDAEIPGQAELLSNMLRKVDDFLTSSEEEVERLDGRSFQVTREDLPEKRKIIVPTFT